MSEENVVLGGRYRLGRILGTGGMADVFLAEDTRLHRTVAVKVLRSDLARDANFQERFRREAHSAASLNHPSIVAVYDTGEEEQTTITGAQVTIPYIVMEYVEGRTLRELIDPEHPMDAHQAGEIMAALLSALEYSHRSGIVHRDIKPGNIMINDAGAVKVMDFGIARAIADATSAMTATQAVMGTAQYLSPEQARGQLVDARSDIYSAACVMYEMLTGRPPFTGDTPVSIAYQHVREEPQPPSAFNPAITPALDAVILTGLAKDREERYPSAVVFSRDIAAVVAGRAPALVPGAVAAGEDPESTTVLSPVEDATEAMPAVAAAAGAGVGAAAAQDWSRGSGPSPTTGPLGLHTPDEVEEEEERRKRPVWLIVLVILAVIALVAAAFAVFDPFRDDGPETVAMPDVVGSTEDEARSILTDAGLEPVFEQTTSTEVAEDLVIETDPPAEEEVAVGEEVTVHVSTGPEGVDVPDIVGMTRDEAEQALEGAGLVPEYAGEEDQKKTERNVVTRSTPAAGSGVREGDTVEFTVASGSFQVPNVEGLDLEAATKTLEDIGFTVESSTREDGSVDPDTVLDQTPVGDTSEEIGATITLIVAAPEGPVSVPNVTGLTLADARDRLVADDFGVETTSEHSDSVEEGRVIRTDPGPNESVDRGTTVTIVVSDGPEPAPEPDPDPTPTQEPTEDPTPTEEPTQDPPGDSSETPSESTGEDDEAATGTGNGNGRGVGSGQPTDEADSEEATADDGN
ncbi:Stk1 family PASTA domain-containing Ser/Thr kinase [Brachybacterium sp. YJGR34]|uniref:Stk1 family PASTA domain-containing Ser/Thr kinase n=1 Tax=Brachybacterium sp. YJGR34 TaxID=2059911 RepID=UPI000E09FF85|nr:Stk1 family PASTA domain-containing Ser/Thr kinase [Brachybacterium sp. YJGR34]